MGQLALVYICLQSIGEYYIIIQFSIEELQDINCHQRFDYSISWNVFTTNCNIMWECNIWDPKQKQIEDKWGLKEIQDLFQAEVLNEHSIVQVHCHAHCQACSQNWCAKNGL
jgi:hypothetical protein